MALTAKSKLVNVEKSINVYAFDNFVTNDGLDVHFVNQRGIFTPSGATWLQFHFIASLLREWVGASDDDMNKGNIVTGAINLNCCELVDQRTGLSYALASIRDTVRARVTEGTAISIKDYDTIGNPGVGHFVVLNVSEAVVQDGFSADHQGVAILNITAEGQYQESFT